MKLRVITSARSRAPKGLIYGAPGSGKTTFGASAPGVLLVDCENGAAHVVCHKTPYLSSWNEIEPWLTALVAEQHDYKVVAIDSIDWLLRRIEEHVAGVDGTASGMRQTLNRSHGGYGAGRQVMKNYIYQYLLPTFDRMVNRGIAVILLAHMVRRVVVSVEGVEVEKSLPEIHPDVANTIIEWCDFVGAIRIACGARELILSETPQVMAKNRYGIVDTVPLAWDAFVGAVSGCGKNKESCNG